MHFLSPLQAERAGLPTPTTAGQTANVRITSDNTIVAPDSTAVTTSYTVMAIPHDSGLGWMAETLLR